MKKLISLLLLLILSISFTSCADTRSTSVAHSNASFVYSEYINLVSIETSENGAYEILFDKNTGVMYLVVKGYGSGMITPIYNSDGTVKLFKGFEK